jgi:Tfp pilus assembly protein PilO
MNARKLATLLNLHLAGAVLLILFDLFLAVELVLAWHDAGRDQSDDYASAQATYAQLLAQSHHLEGLPAKIDTARQQGEAFYTARIPANDSTIVSELGELSVRDHVRLSRAQYTPAPAIPGLTEVRIDASLTGSYTELMHFINDMERDKTHAFFIIRAVTFTGQQGGLVNLRLRITTYMRSDAATNLILANSAAGSGAASEVQ